MRALLPDGTPGTLLYASGQIRVEGLPPPLRISLKGGDRPIRRVRIDFTQPTELKAAGRIVLRPDFGTLLARVRDRISALDHFYGTRAVTLDWKGLAALAEPVSIVREQLRTDYTDRRSV